MFNKINRKLVGLSILTALVITLLVSCASIASAVPGPGDPDYVDVVDSCDNLPGTQYPDMTQCYPQAIVSEVAMGLAKENCKKRMVTVQRYKMVRVQNWKIGHMQDNGLWAPSMWVWPENWSYKIVLKEHRRPMRGYEAHEAGCRPTKRHR